MADIDRLEIQIESYAGKANSELDKLARRLEKIEGNLIRINASGLSNFAAGIEKLSQAMQSINSVKTSQFTALSKNIQKLAATDSASILRASTAINTISRSIENAGAAMQSSVNISEMAKNIAKLGGKNVERAITLLPKLAQELKNLMTTLSQAPNVSKNVIQMTNALANLSNSLKGIRATSTQGGSSLSKLPSIFGRTSQAVQRSGGIFGRFASAAGTFYARFWAIVRGVKAVGKAIESAMDYVETYNYFSVTMDKIGKDFGSQYEKFGYESAESYADSFTNRLNELTRKMTGFSVGKNGELNMTDSIGLALDPEKIQNFQASVAAVTNSVGLIGETSVNTSKALTMLSADLSSLKNVDLNTVMTNLQSGLIGQSRALYKYGIDITNNTLQTYAYTNGVNKAVSEMTQAEKMQLRLLAILDQSKVAWGDQANTINSVANQYRILKQQISNLARIIGNLFLPIVQKVLPVVNGIIIAIQRLFTALGFKLWGGDWLKNTMDGISGGSSNMDDLGDSADDASDAMDKAAAAAKKLKTTVLGIDELNINNPNDDSGSGSGSGGGAGFDLSDAIGSALADYESVWDEAFANAANKAQEYADAICKAFSDAFKTGDFSNIGRFVSDNLTKALNSIEWEKVYEGAKFFGRGLATFLNGLITPEEFAAIGRTIAGVMNTVVYSALSFGQNLDWTNIGLSIATGINNFFETFDFASAAETLNTWVQGLFDAVKTAISNIEWDKVLEGIWDFFSNIDISTVGIVIGTLTLKSVGNIVFGGSLFKFLTETVGGKISKVIASGIGAKLGLELGENAGIASAFLELAKKMGTIFSTGFSALLGNKAAESALAFSDLFNPITLAITGIISTLGGAVLAVKNFFSMWKEGFSWIKDALMVVGVAIAAIGAVILGAPALVAAAIAGIVAAVATAVIVIKDNWENIKNFFVETFDNIYSAASNKWNEVVDWWNSSIGAWWNENVSPWFTAEKWKTLYQSVKESLKSVWNETVVQWANNISKWWDESVAPWFTLEKWKNLYASIKSSLKTKWDETVLQWKSSIQNWWNNHVAPWFTVTKWVNAMSGIKEGFKESFRNAANAAIDIVNRLIRYLNEKFHISWDGFTLPNGDKIGAFSMQLFKMSEIPHFAEGGYPEKGQLFMARENGMNEYVGSIGNRSAVANNDQIVAGIKQGVYEAMTEAMQYMMSQSTEQPIIVQTTVEMDGKAIVQQTDKARRRMGWNFQPI